MGGYDEGVPVPAPQHLAPLAALPQQGAPLFHLHADPYSLPVRSLLQQQNQFALLVVQDFQALLQRPNVVR